MTEIEITEIPPLLPNEQSLLELHSLLNLLNVLRGELALIGLSLTADVEFLTHGLAVCDQFVREVREGRPNLGGAERVDALSQTILAEIDAAQAIRPGTREDPEIVESLANLQSVFAVLRVRARELLARHQEPELWAEFSAATVRRDFLAVFAAMEKNSRRRFRIIYNAALQSPGDYYIDLKIESASGDRLWMPPVFQDVMRDLTANARKYTAPGGHITAALWVEPDFLRFVVEDTGRGIPADELTAVVHFGHRAANVADVRTFGGGFGLTKAFFVTKQFGGRFWIASEIGRGTRIRLEIPRTATAAHN